MKIGPTNNQNLASLENLMNAQGFKGSTKLRANGGELYGSNNFKGFNKDTRLQKQQAAKQFISNALQNTINSVMNQNIPNKEQALNILNGLRNSVANFQGELRGIIFRDIVTQAKNASVGNVGQNIQQVNQQNNRNHLGNVFDNILGN